MGRIENNLPCVTCGYTLRGLPSDGACPECGMAISRSLQGERLVAADPQWLRTIVRGQRLLTAGLMTAVTGALIILFCGVAFVLIAIVFRFGLPAIVEDSFVLGVQVVFLSIPIGMCIGLVGVVFLTSQEGRDTERESNWSARILARWSMFGLIITVIMGYSIHVLPGMGAMWFAVDLFIRALAILLLTVAGVSLLQRLEALIRRVPDQPLARKIRSHWKLIRWAVPAAGIYLLILPRIGFGGGRMGGTSLLIAPFACAGFIAAIILLLESTRVVRTMRKCTAAFQDCLIDEQPPSEQTAR